MLSKVHTATLKGFDVQSVVTEVHVVKRGFPTFKIVGLPHKSVSESRERVRSSINVSGFSFPQAKVIVNLAPADVPKIGSHFDLSMAIGILVASGYIKETVVRKSLFLAELSLDGELSSAVNVIPFIEYAKKLGYKEVYISRKDTTYTQYAQGINVYAANSLSELVCHLQGKKMMKPLHVHKWAERAELHVRENPFESIHAQSYAKRAIIIAAAGAHNICLYGPPGNGKTLLAKCLSKLLPPFGEEEFKESLLLNSLYSQSVSQDRPYRNPHYSITRAQLLGSIRNLPGEVSKAHCGVLHIDEYPLARASVINALRHVLDEYSVRISGSHEYLLPAKCILALTANPCPCGYLGHQEKECTCSQQSIVQFVKQMKNTPLLDRIDMHVFVDVPDRREKSSEVRFDSPVQEVNKAWNVQAKRYGSYGICNGHVSHEELEKYAYVSDPAKRLLDESATKLGISMRSYHKLLGVARTIADLEEQSSIQEHHIAEALQYRSTVYV